MAKVKVNFDAMKTNIMNKETARKIGVVITGTSKRMISKGLSPVKGEGRFESYAAQRASAGAKKIKKSLKSKAGRAKASQIIKAKEQGSYPWTVMDRFPGKQVRPVNLSLNGWYLKHLRWWHINGFKTAMSNAFSSGPKKTVIVNVGFSSSSQTYSKPPKRVEEMFETHNEGMHKHVPQRKHLPTGMGETFNVSIMRDVKKIIEKRVSDVVKFMNKKENKKS